MASSALAAFKKYRRQKEVNNEQEESARTPSQRTTRANSKKKALNKKRASEKGEGTVAPMAPTSTMTRLNDEGSVRKKKKGKNLKTKKDDGTKRGNLPDDSKKADAGNTVMRPANEGAGGLTPVNIPLSPGGPVTGANICWDVPTLINDLLHAGRIDSSGNDDVRVAMQAFAKKAAQITASGALNEYMTTLKTYIPENTTRAAFDANADKNRYQDVICADRERVKLADRPNLTDYIHANHITGKPFPANHAFICTQGPFSTTVTEFWRMVRQEQVDSVVMLCETVECGKNKCAQYWPLNHGETMAVPAVDFMITNKGMYTHEPGLISTVLCLKDATGAEQRVVHHQWKNWPDRGVPERTDVTLKLLQLTRPSFTDTKQCTIVHCSAGIGRTGSVVAVELCTQRLLSGKTVDVLSLVKHLRTKRMHSIQTDQQYLFVYKVLLALIREHVNDPETQQAIDSYNSGYDAIVKGIAGPQAQTQVAAVPDPIANASSPFSPIDYATVPPQQPDQHLNHQVTSTMCNNNFLSY